MEFSCFSMSHLFIWESAGNVFFFSGPSEANIRKYLGFGDESQ